MNQSNSHNQRIIISAPLIPIFPTIQPASFPHVGHALYTEPLSNRPCLIVDTPQSVANYLEEVTWDSLKLKLVETLTGLPYVELRNSLTDAVIASSITINHRLGSGYLALHIESQLKKILIEEINAQGFYPTLLKYDPNSIIHGCFINRLENDRVYRMRRIITGYINAYNVVSVPMGGASKDVLSASGKDWDMSFFKKEKKDKGEGAKGEDKASSYGLGNLPYNTQEYSCGSVTAKFVINCNLIEATGLPQPAQDLLKAISQWKVLTFLHSTIRLRSTEYECGEIEGNEAPLDLLEQKIPQLIKTCAQKGYFANPAVTTVSITLQPKPKKPKSAKSKEEEDSCSQLELNY